MGLTDRLSNTSKGTRPQDSTSAGGSLIGATVRRRKDAIADSSRRLKVKVHNKLFETIDVSKLETLEPAMVSTKVTAAINEILNEDGRLLTDIDGGRLIEELKNELLGLGPLEPLLRDDEITDILVNGHDQVYVEKHGKLHVTDVVFQDDQDLMLIIDRIVSRVGRRVDESSPMVDARLPDGSRINAIIPPLALDGPALSIRRFGKHRFDIGALVEKEALTWDLVEFMLAVVRARLNVIVCGGTGSARPRCSIVCPRSFPKTNESSQSRIPPSFPCNSLTSCGSRRARPTSRGAARSPSATSSKTACECAPTESSSARSAALKSSTCCRPCPPATTALSPPSTPTARASAWAGSR